MAFVYELTVKDNGTATLKKVGGEFDNLKKKSEDADKSIGKLGLGLVALGAQAASKAIGALSSFGKEMIDSYDSAAKLSQNIGITAESVIGLRHAAELSAVGAEAMDKNMEKLSKTMFDAASGNKSAGESFKQLGISVTNSDGSLKKSDAVLMEMADKFKALPSGAERAAAAMNIFGKSGASMVSMLKDGSASLKKMTDEGAGAAGNIASVSETMEKLNDAGTKAKAVLMGLLAGIVDSAAFKTMISGFNAMSDALIKWRTESKAVAKEEADINKLNLVYYTEQIAKLNLIKETNGELTSEQEKLKIGIGNQIVALKKKVSLEEYENELMIANANLMARKEQYLLSENSIGEETKKRLQNNIKFYENQIATLEKKKADAANDAAGTSIIPKDDSAAKALEAKKKMLEDWLANYRKSKLTEEEIAEAAYNEDLAKFKALKDEKMISDEAYNDFLGELQVKRSLASIEYNDKQKELREKEQAELAASLEREAEARRQHEDVLRGYRETAAGSDAERIAIQMEGINARYDAEIEKARAAGESVLEIERAKNAEIERMERQLAQMRQDAAMQQIDAQFKIAEAAAVFSKNGAQAQKAIAMSQATINTALAATKAAAAAPFPVNIPLVAGAIAQGAVQLKTISAQKFADGGMIPGVNTLIMANEQGREAILNPRGVRNAGGEAGVNALNRGTSNTYNNSRSNTVNVNISTSILTQKTFRDEIQPVLRQAERRR
ncbi:MAG: hypothetical protein LBC64_01915 [Fibromonadaceae bacterium]|jgi:hypothetical protein|nr:hypothetical protein [Fibromonadaceae bacterium]